MQGIYKIVNKVDGKYYVGSSNDIGRRFEEHRRRLEKGSHDNPHLRYAWNKYGGENFVFEFVEEVLGGREAHLVCEQGYLDDGFKKEILYNVAKRADCPGNEERSKEHRANIRKALLGANNPMYGKRYSKEEKAKMSEAKLGKNNPMYGKHHSDLTREKLSEARIAWNETHEHPRGMKGKHHTKETKMKIGKVHRGNEYFAKPYSAFYNSIKNEYIPGGHNLLRMCRTRGLTYDTMLNLKRGNTKCSRGGWRLAGLGEIDKNEPNTE